MRKEGSEKNNLATLLSEDPIFKERSITKSTIDEILSDKAHFIGNAREQMQRVYATIDNLTKEHPFPAMYEPQPIF